MAMEPTESALIVAVPEAEHAVGRFRAAHVLTQAAEAVTAHLPIRAAVGSVRLIAGTLEPDSWHTVHEFGLGAPKGSGQQ